MSTSEQLNPNGILSNIVVFASGSGTNFQSIIDAAERGDLDATISGLVTDRKDIGAIDRARLHDIPVYISDPSDLSNQKMYELNLLQKLQEWETDLIALAGYLKKIPPAVLDAFPKRILNIHPSLLPKFGGKGFYGSRVHAAVLEAGETESGCSVHIVTEEFDEGPVIARAKVPVKDKDTPKRLGNRVLEQEHQLYPKAIQEYLSTLT